MRRIRQYLIAGITTALFLSFFGAAQAQKKRQEQSHKTDDAFTSMAEQNLIDGMRFFMLEKYEAARQQFEKAYAKAPSSPGINYMLAKVYFLGNNNNQATYHIEKAIKAEPLNLHFLVLQAQIFQSEQKFAEAAKVYKKIVSEIPGTSDYYFDLASSYLYTRKYTEAVNTYNKIEEIYGKSREITEVKQKIWLQLNKPDLAVQEGQQLIDAYPEDNEYKVMQAELLYSLNRKTESQKILEDILKNAPEDPYAHLALSEIYGSQNQAEKALAELKYVFKSEEMSLEEKLEILEGLMNYNSDRSYNQKIVELSLLLTQSYPEDYRSWAAAGESYLRLDESKEAYTNFLHALQIDNTNYGLWKRIILLDSELNKTDSVLVHCEKALELFPNNAELWFYKGVANYQRKNFKLAAEDMESCAKLAGSNKELKVNAYGILGDAYNGMKDYMQSDASYEKALALNPEDTYVLNNYAYFLSLRKDKLEKAESMSAVLVKKYPSNANYLDTHAWVLYQGGKYKEAEEFLRRAADLAPNNGTIIEHYGDVLFKLGRNDEAVSKWKLAKKVGNTSDKIDQKILNKTLYE